MLFKVILLTTVLGAVSAQTTLVTVPATGLARFISPGHPAQYGNGLTVVYRLTGPAGSGIQCDAETFATEARYDTLTFTELVNGLNVTVGAPFSGNEGPNKLVSKSNAITVIFKTDSSVSAIGFRIACRVPVCPAGQSLCPGSETKCLTPAQWCNGENDCEDGADENQYCRVGCGIPAIPPNLGSSFRQMLASMSQGKVKVSERIVGGTVAVKNSWPWQVAMLSASGSQICGGSIINNEWIMTAAHCCRAYSAVPSSYKVRVGAHNLNAGAAAEPNAKTYTLARLVVHPQYIASPVAQNDFCLLKVSEPLRFSAEVEPVCLPAEDGSDEAPGTKCWVTGWGSTAANRGNFEEFLKEVKAEEAGKVAKNLQRATRATPALYQVAVNITTQDVCSKAYPGNISPQMICAAAPGKDSCQGDSGGPFVCQKAPVAGVEQPFKLVGVVSWGYGCARPTHPGVYARTSTALSWITEVIYG